MIHLEDLARHIRLGEDSLLALKQVLMSGSRVTVPRRDEFADELAAMANCLGGVMVLGVDDQSRDISGIPINQLDAVETWVGEICSDSVKPPMEVAIRKTTVPGNPVSVICVDVPRSLFIHRSPGGYFRRFGSSKRELSSDTLARLFQERSQSRVKRFDQSPVPGTSAKYLDEDLTGRLFSANAVVTEDILKKLRVLDEDKLGNTQITGAGALLCTQEPEQWLSHAQIQAVSYVGERTDINYQNDAQDFAGPLDSQVLGALSFVQRNMRVAAVKTIGRWDLPQFRLGAVFEALVNAVAHRDYSVHGARIRLHLFSNRLELYVPGALANTLTPDSMHLRQYSRNELIVSLLTRCSVEGNENLDRSRMMERRGDGVPIILSESIALSGRPPEYSWIDDSELRLVIWAATTGSPEDLDEE